MYTVYIIFAVVLGLSFVTGSVMLVKEHKLAGKKITFQQGTFVDEEIL